MMQYKDHGNNGPLLAFIAQTATGDVTGATCDLKDYDGCEIVVNVGNSGDTLSGSVYIELEVETSDDGSTWADAADADLSSSVTGTNTGTFAKIDAPAEDSAIFTVSYLGRERYVRVIANLTGTHTNGCPIGAHYNRTRAKV